MNSRDGSQLNNQILVPRWIQTHFSSRRLVLDTAVGNQLLVRIQMVRHGTTGENVRHRMILGCTLASSSRQNSSSSGSVIEKTQLSRSLTCQRHLAFLFWIWLKKANHIHFTGIFEGRLPYSALISLTCGSLESSQVLG